MKRNDPIKILSIVWYKVLPARFGGQQTIAAFNNELGKHAELVCLCSYNNIPDGNESYKIIAELPVAKTQFLNPFTWKKIYDIARKEKITHIIIEHPYHAIGGWICKKKLGCNIIHYSHNIEYLRFKELNKWYWRLLKKQELWLTGFADLNICVTNEDAEVLMSETGISNTKTFNLPHVICKKGISRKPEARELICEKHNIPSHYFIILFNGTLDYEPNYEAVMHICNEIVPSLGKKVKDFVILITGRCETKLLHIPSSVTEIVQYQGEVEDVANYFLSADIYINPVQKGEGVQTKTLEALSYNLNVVCYQHMLRGIIVELVREKLFVAQDTGEFIDQIQSALKVNKVINDGFFDFYSYNHHFPSFIDKLKQL